MVTDSWTVSVETWQVGTGTFREHYIVCTLSEPGRKHRVEEEMFAKTWRIHLCS